MLSRQYQRRLTTASPRMSAYLIGGQVFDAVGLELLLVARPARGVRSEWTTAMHVLLDLLFCISTDLNLVVYRLP